MERLRPGSLALVLACVLAAPVSAATRAYFVEPKTALNGWTPLDAGIGQTFTANVDSIVYIEWFVGELSAEGAYRFEILDHITAELICQGDMPVPARGWQWLRCDSFYDGSRRFTKGREYLLKVSHDGGDSVNYVYRMDNPYPYGEMSGEHVPNNWDLAARVYGVMDAVDSSWFDSSPFIVSSFV